MAIDWSKPIRTRLHQHIVVLIRRECWVDDQPRRIVRIPGYCLGTFMYREDGAPAMNAPAIENYDPEVENKPVTVDWTKPIQTRDGYPARVLCTDLKSGTDREVAVVVSYQEDDEGLIRVAYDGRMYDKREYPGDIINVPEKGTVYINIYSPNDMVLHTTKEAAEQYLIKALCIARVKVEYTVGQFDI